ncbi:NRDE family protein [Colwellia psychrerythraea]|uniref:NRDE family protein n=1 Tax=Colwellia psychrerythraea (strain 34H / ATCC BAA-681) TaxID=167879 RepID=Q47ZR0_COLP3|nr:NRDE family protein [Colwellia psychrerythraea]AAZ24367.1 hypothetical protein CPS_3010 [Colwellia psychrerythraea 34H]
MCTVSWLVDNNDYHVFFNRDEQRSRSLAIAPKPLSINNTSTLMPIDPDGNGTWISTNEFGLSLCLLNYYQGIKPQGALISRGLLVKTLSAKKTLQEAHQALSQSTLNDYASFSLLAFGFDASGQFVQQTWQWNGEQLTKIELNSPFTSSSVEFEHVSTSRLALANRMPMRSVADLAIYHQSHQPDKSHLSACMHRTDAKSVSFSHIHVSQQQSFFHYKNASPCSSQPFETSELAR